MAIEKVIIPTIVDASVTVTGVGAAANQTRVTFVAAHSRYILTVAEPVVVPRVVGRLVKVPEPTFHRAVLGHIIRFVPREVDKALGQMRLVGVWELGKVIGRAAAVGGINMTKVEVAILIENMETNGPVVVDMGIMMMTYPGLRRYLKAYIQVKVLSVHLSS
jgi:hypothetical protein